MRKLSVSTLVTLDGVIQDPGGFGETAHGGWGNRTSPQTRSRTRWSTCRRPTTS
jgi:hypothetical protein